MAQILNQPTSLKEKAVSNGYIDKNALHKRLLSEATVLTRNDTGASVPLAIVVGGAGLLFKTGALVVIAFLILVAGAALRIARQDRFMRRAFGIAIALKTPQSEKGMIYNAGAQGEAAVSDALAKLPDTYFVVQDLQISTAHGSAQIDHLVSDLTVFSMSKLRTSAVVSLLVLASTGPRRGTLER